ncbi:hypothetical protein HDK77DRAFT_458040 [Phyllosticta capitalensis]
MGGGVKLKIGGSFFDWKTSLISALAQINVVGHVFHDIKGIPPKEEPLAPTGTVSTAAQAKYEKELGRWLRNDLIARNIIIQSLDHSLKLPADESVYRNISAKAIFDRVIVKCRKWALDERGKALDGLCDAKFTSDADEYIDTFSRNLRILSDADWLINPEEHAKNPNGYCYSDSEIARMFATGTSHVEWLHYWYTSMYLLEEEHSLEKLMISLRRFAGGRIASTNPALDGKCVGDEPGDLCNKKGCQRLKNHTNARCFSRKPQVKR